MTLKLRSAHAGDTGILTDVLHRSKASWDYPAEKLEAFRSSCKVTNETLATQDIIVAEEDGTAIGFAGGYLREDHFYLEFLFVVPEAKSKGVGSLLLDRMTDVARAAGISRIVLESDYYARPFYEAKGYKVLGDRPSPMAPGGVLPLMDKHLSPTVSRLDSIDLRFDTTTPWPFEQALETEVARHWETALAENPHLWNGRILKLTGYTFENGAFRGICQEGSFAGFLAWRDWGCPDRNTHNVFGSAVLRSSDGALLYGIMSNTTANSGKIYPPGGNLDHVDIRPDGKIDVIGAIYRELQEETGLTPLDTMAGPLLIVFDGPRISICLVLDVPMQADALRERICRYSEGTEEQEIADMFIVRTRTDLDAPGIFSFARSVALALLPQQAV